MIINERYCSALDKTYFVMAYNELPQTIDETQNLIDELLDFAEKEKDIERRKEILMLSIELKSHLITLNRSKRKRYK